MECPTPATADPGGATASRARVSLRARRSNSPSEGLGETSRSKCGATTVHPDSARALRSGRWRSGLPPAPTAKNTTVERGMDSRTVTANDSDPSVSVNVDISSLHTPEQPGARIGPGSGSCAFGCSEGQRRHANTGRARFVRFLAETARISESAAPPRAKRRVAPTAVWSAGRPESCCT